jgi:hypothetical protein
VGKEGNSLGKGIEGGKIGVVGTGNDEMPGEEGIDGSLLEETGGKVGDVGKEGKVGVDKVAGNSGNVGLGPSEDRDGGAVMVPKDNS